jgi:DMSO/TMAO reductase YedYZ molybdopterin-dependent catalytic subunit
MLLGRRRFLFGAVGALTSLATGRALGAQGERDLVGPAALPAGALESSLLHALPGKQPLIKRTFRPPNYETPVRDLARLFTENRKFFVRYHLLSIPEIDAAKWRLRVGGDAAEKSIELSLDELRKQFEPVEIAAVCQCAGNRRGLSDPHVPGVQWGYGAMGNARWKGVRLRDVLERVRPRPNALEVVFDGADAAVVPKTPDFVKSLPVKKALDENTLIAFEMNGAPLPHWNGFPARVVVPGWTATYWVKHLTSIDVVAKPFDGFWMKTAYRIPNGLFPVGDRFLSQETASNTPITGMLVNSLFTNVANGQRFAATRPLDLTGIAWDGGSGIERVEASSDGGITWAAAELGDDAGRFSWRTWRWAFRPGKPGAYTLAARATNRAGITQSPTPLWNPAGYHHNGIQKVGVVVE